MEDIVIYLDRQKAMDALKARRETRSLLEYDLEDGVGKVLMYVYVCNENGQITKFKI